jgi:hypothetical protein
MMVGGVVTAAEMLWPGTASAVYDGLTVMGMFALSAGRRD